MNIDWDTLQTFDDWSAALDRILGQARMALKSGDTPGRADVQQQLADYIAHSPNRLAAELDAIARRTMDDLVDSAIDDALGSLATRSAELSLHAKTIADIAGAAEQRARSIRLERARAVVDAATSTVQSLAGLRQSLGDAADDKLVADKIDKAVKAIHELVPLVMRVKG